MAREVRKGEPEEALQKTGGYQVADLKYDAKATQQWNANSSNPRTRQSEIRQERALDYQSAGPRRR